MKRAPTIAITLLIIAMPGLRISVCAGTEIEKIPFVSCESDGQQGPKAALDKPQHEHAPESPDASRLAFYQAWGTPAVLGPRGWHCTGLDGSNGNTLVLTPEKHKPGEFIFGKTKVTGPAIQISYLFGGTSGRFEVAEIAARLFPKADSFVRSVEAEQQNILGNNSFRFRKSRYPTDRLTYRDDFMVEYVTPPNRDGMGTRTFLTKNETQIDGIVVMQPNGDRDLVLLAIRLPASLKTLEPFIIKDAEHRSNLWR